MKHLRMRLSPFRALVLSVLLTSSVAKGEPFPEPVVYPNIPAIILSEVKIMGGYAAEGDQVAAYVGDELRGVATVILSGGKAYATLLINVDEASEEATLKAYDASLDVILEHPQLDLRRLNYIVLKLLVLMQ